MKDILSNILRESRRLKDSAKALSATNGWFQDVTIYQGIIQQLEAGLSMIDDVPIVERGPYLRFINPMQRLRIEVLLNIVHCIENEVIQFERNGRFVEWASQDKLARIEIGQHAARAYLASNPNSSRNVVEEILRSFEDAHEYTRSLQPPEQVPADHTEILNANQDEDMSDSQPGIPAVPDHASEVVERLVIRVPRDIVRRYAFINAANRASGAISSNHADSVFGLKNSTDQIEFAASILCGNFK